MSEILELAPGQSRIVREEPCPPSQFSRPDEYYLLKRAAQRLLQQDFHRYWIDHGYRDEVNAAFETLRDLAEKIPAVPSAAWMETEEGIVREIRCPNCLTVFEWRGNFYAPRCSKCQMFLRKRTEQSNG
jgi:hypothetical protein